MYNVLHESFIQYVTKTEYELKSTIYTPFDEGNVDLRLCYLYFSSIQRVS